MSLFDEESDDDNELEYVQRTAITYMKMKHIKHICKLIIGY